MSKIKGQDLVVMFRIAHVWKAVAYATDCELDIDRTMMDVGSQESGTFREYKPKKIGWRITSAHLMSDKDQPVDIDDLLVEGTQVQVTFSTIMPHPDPQPDPPAYQPGYRFWGPPYGYAYTRTGYAYVQRHTVTARHRTYVTSSIELLGTGPLLKGPQDKHDFGPTSAPDFGPAQNPDYNV